MEFRKSLSLQTSTRNLMRSLLACVAFLIISFASFSQSTFQLAPPLIKYRSVFFKDTAMLAIQFQQAGAEIHFTLNNDEPSENDALYKEPIVIKDKQVTVKARSFGKGFLPSD